VLYQRTSAFKARVGWFDFPEGSWSIVAELGTQQPTIHTLVIPGCDNLFICDERSLTQIGFTFVLECFYGWLDVRRCALVPTKDEDTRSVALGETFAEFGCESKLFEGVFIIK
jgi:hypothetical protein